MFEKESEIYALSNFGFRGKNSQRVLTAKIDYQYGAEFGYNKANEWHYVKDGDLPPKDTRVFALMVSGEVCIAHFYRKNVWDKIGTVYAWKEIVLPELPKEIKEK